MMNKYQEAIDKIKNMGDKDLYNEFHLEWVNSLQELVDKYEQLEQENKKLKYKATPKKMEKTKKHSWIKNEDGEIDNWQYTFGEYHNGPECEICSYGFCHHCKNEYDDETCIEHYICECGNHLKGTEKFCPNCGQKLDWSDD